MNKFKPCPFCGCHVPPAVQGNGIGDNWLECTECGASTRLREDGAGSEKDWNRRAARATAPSDVKDAARYRWLSKRVVITDGSTPGLMVITVVDDGAETTNEFLDEFTEQAIAVSAPRGEL